MPSSPKREQVFKGIAASPGIAIGSALTISNTLSSLNIEEVTISPDQVATELTKFNNALEKTREQIKQLQEKLENDQTDAKATSIFDAHLLIVDDQILMKEVVELITKHHKSSDFAFHKIIERYASAISVMPDPYIRERVADIKDVSSRVLSNLRGEQKLSLNSVTGQKIIIAHELTPSDTALMEADNILAFTVESGSRTSHTAILARSMKIPAVVGSQGVLENVNDGDLVIVDGFIGTIIINPTKDTQHIYAIKEAKKEKYYADLLKESTLRPETIDGFCIQLAANIEGAADVKEAKRFGAAGVGLFRTEYLYLNEASLPSEEKQFNIYRQIATDLNGQPTLIRTLDVGGDKLAHLLTTSYEPNPFLGLRAIRLCLAKPELLKTQLRAILRASAYGNIKMLFPMVTCLEELDQLLAIVEEIKEELKEKKQPYNADISIGIMIETPSAALIADALAKKVDFFSIGTNDLVQYTMAVDRSNEKVAYLYQPSHPAILRLIKMIVDAANNNHIWVSVCGEMASDPRFIPLLVGLGVHELSMGPVSLGIIRRIIRRMKMHETEKIAEQALLCNTAEEAMEISEAFLYRVAPDIIDLTNNGL